MKERPFPTNEAKSLRAPIFRECFACSPFLDLDHVLYLGAKVVLECAVEVAMHCLENMVSETAFGFSSDDAKARTYQRKGSLDDRHG